MFFLQGRQRWRCHSVSGWRRNWCMPLYAKRSSMPLGGSRPYNYSHMLVIYGRCARPWESLLHIDIDFINIFNLWWFAFFSEIFPFCSPTLSWGLPVHRIHRLLCCDLLGTPCVLVWYCKGSDVMCFEKNENEMIKFCVKCWRGWIGVKELRTRPP